MSMGQMTVGGVRLWTRTLDRITRADFPEFMISKSQCLRQIQYRIKHKDTHLAPEEIKILDHTGNQTRADGLEGSDSTYHVTATDNHEYDNKIRAKLRRN